MAGQATQSPDQALYSIWGPELRCWQRDEPNAPPPTWSRLWPNEQRLRALFKDIPTTERRSVAQRCCQMALACGPSRVLAFLLDDGLVKPSATFRPDNVTLLHLACLYRNADAVKLLANRYKVPWRRDSRGRYPKDMCWCETTWRALPFRRRFFSSIPSLSSERDENFVRERIFDLVSDSRAIWHEVQLLLQENSFDVNGERHSGNFLVHVLVEQGGIKSVPRLLSLRQIQKAKVNVFNLDGMTPLAIAADKGDVLMVETLVALAGADPNLANSQTGLTPLHYAARKNDLLMIKCLLKWGSICSIEDNRSRFPERVTDKKCQKYLKEERIERSALIKQKCAKGLLKKSDLHESDLSTVDDNGDTPLMAACKANKVDMIELLASFSSLSLNGQNIKTGKTPLAICAELGHLSCLEKLIKLLRASGALGLSNGFQIKDFNIPRYLPLHHACKNGHLDCVKEILRHSEGLVGLDEARRMELSDEISEQIIKATKDRQTLVVNPILFNACKTGDVEKLEAFAFEDGDDFNDMNLEGETPIYVAARNGCLSIVEYLKERGASLLFCHKNSVRMPLHIASREGRRDVVEYLVQFCRTSNDPDLEECPDERAAHFRYIDSLMIDARDADGATSLELAVNEGNKDVVEILLKAGASATKPGQDGKLVSSVRPEINHTLNTWRSKRLKKIFKIIKDPRSTARDLKRIWRPPYDHNLRDSHGESPLMIACTFGRLDLLDLLLQSVNHYRLHDDERGEIIEKMREKAQDYVDRSFRPPAASTPQRKQFRLNRSVSCPPDRIESRQAADTSLYGGMASLSFDGDYLFVASPFDGRTALHRAVENGKPYVVGKILRVNASCVNVPDVDGMTALHLACQKNNTSVVRKFLDLYPLTDLFARDKKGLYPENHSSTPTIRKIIRNARKQFYPDNLLSETSMTEISMSEESPGGGSESDDAFHVDGTLASVTSTPARPSSPQPQSRSRRWSQSKMPVIGTHTPLRSSSTTAAFHRSYSNSASGDASLFPNVPTAGNSSVGVASGELPNFDEMNTRAVLSSNGAVSFNSSVRSTDSTDFEDTERKFKAKKALFQGNN